MIDRLIFMAPPAFLDFPLYEKYAFPKAYDSPPEM
jgi:hypothetical protein